MNENQSNSADDGHVAREDSVSESLSEDSVRVGSPFAPGSITGAAQASDKHFSTVAIESSSAEVITDGVLKYTAQGSATASLLVIFFAVVSVWWFPAGGVVVAALGSALAVGGMFSQYRLPSAGLLLIHLGLFFASYTMAIR